MLLCLKYILFDELLGALRRATAVLFPLFRDCLYPPFFEHVLIISSIYCGVVGSSLFVQFVLYPAYLVSLNMFLSDACGKVGRVMDRWEYSSRYPSTSASCFYGNACWPAVWISGLPV